MVDGRAGRLFAQDMILDERVQTKRPGDLEELQSKRIADALEKPDCEDCYDNGYIDVDIGGGNTRTTFCACQKGQELLEADEKAREEKIYDS